MIELEDTFFWDGFTLNSWEIALDDILQAAGRLFPADRLATQTNCASKERWDVLSAGARFTIEMYEMYMAAFAA